MAFGTAIGWFTLTLTADPVISILVLVVSVGVGAATTFWIGTVYSYGVLRVTIKVAVVLSFFSMLIPGSRNPGADLTEHPGERDDLSCNSAGL